MLNHGITHDDRRMACVRARFVIPSFRVILRKDLEACLADRGSVPIEEFVDYFNHMNKRRGCKALDFRGVKPPAFFEALVDVCKVDPEYTRLYPVPKQPQGSLASNKRKPRQSSRSQPPSAEASWPWPSHVSSQSTSPVISPRRHSVPPTPTSKTDQSSPRILPSGPTASDLLDPPRNLTIAEVQRILVSFTHGLSNKRLTWECYWNNLKEHDLAVSERFSVMRKTDTDRIDFIEKQVSGVKNSIEVTKCDSIMTVAISKCTCCRSSSLSPVPLSVASEGDDERDFSESLGRFRNIELPLNTSLGVDVTEVDFIPRRLRLRFVWRNERFEELHAELQSQYQNNHSTIDDIRVGLICAVPLDGTKDYHRGIVKDISHPALPVVFYIDLGIEVKVARGCIRRLYENLLTVPTFCLAADVCNSPLFEERILLAKKLRKKERVLLCADEYDKVRGRYLVRLETDSGFMSDCGRD